MKNKYSYVLNSIFKIIVILLLPNSINAQFGSPFVIDSANNTLVNTINIVDLDNDNQKDILVSNLYDSVYWYKNNGLLFNRMSAISNTVKRPYFVDCADVDGNGLQDVLVSYDDVYAGLKLFKNFGGNTWQQIIINDSIDAFVVRSYLVDLDNDSDLDIISCQDLEVAIYEQSAGTFSGMIKVADSSEFYNLVVHDFTGDGFVDFSVHSAAGFRLFINNHNLTFSPQTFTTALYLTLESCDIDNDGDFDLFYPDSAVSFNLITLKNDGSGGFSNFQSVMYHAGNNQNPPLKFLTLDNDTFPDALYIPLVNRGLYYKSNDGIGGLNISHFIDSVYRYTFVNGGDLDGDNDNDLVWFANEPFGIKRVGYTLNNSGNTDYNELSSQEFYFYPNPVSNNILNIKYFSPTSSGGVFEIVDAIGKTVFKYTLPLYSSNHQITLPQLQNGVYNAMLTYEGAKICRKLAIVDN